MKNNVTYKEWLGLPAAGIFWAVSIFCFVLGLAFENQTGMKFLGVDIAVLFAFGLGLANTIVQIIGNDQTKEELGMPLFLGWIASYAFGIGSNVNYLNTLINIGNPLLKFMICWGLGGMIEVLPERFIVRFIRAYYGKPAPTHNNQRTANNQSVGQNTMNPQQLEQYMAQQQSQRRAATSQHQAAGRGTNQRPRTEPTYHPMSYQGNQSSEEEDVPYFLKPRRGA